MEVGDERFEFAQIRDLYDSEHYPLARGTLDRYCQFNGQRLR
jgi:hypothetical protein